MNETSQTTLPYILGTAGHIDHGKTSLVKMLTGVETDRLAEEKQRGITIELGFASLDLGNQQRVGVVDVPGHERFVRQMIAGATGIDCALLVIAADDGVMPQTREHTQIMELLGVANLVVALTKIDLVDPEWIELVTADIASFLETTPYSNAPIIPCSSVTGAGKDELLATLADTFATITRSHTAKQQLIRLPIDRVFTLKGAGTVVTGTLWSGTLSVDNEVEVYPRAITTRARSIQVHNTDVTKASPGQRTAVNLVGVAKEDIHRGDTLCTPGTLRDCTHFDARFTYLGEEGSDRTFVSGTRIHINHGTTEVLGRILILDHNQELQPHTTALVQIRLEEPLAIRSHDRFIVRSYSPVHMIGGGEALLCSTARRTVLSPHERALLNALEQRSGDEALCAVMCSTLPRTAAEIASDLDVTVSECAPILDKAAHAHDDKICALKTSAGTSYVTPEALGLLLEKLERILISFHENNPHQSGMSESSLNAALDARIGKPVFLALLDKLQRQNKIVRNGGLISHTNSQAHLNDQIDQTKSALTRLMARHGLATPFVDEISKELDVDKNLILRALTELAQEGVVQKISPEYYVLKSQYDQAVSEVRGFITDHGPATTSKLREMLQISRKFAIPFLTALDARRITKRNGDTRELW